MSEPTSGRVSSLYDWTHGEDCDWQFCRNKATGRCCVCWGEPYCTPPASGRVQPPKKPNVVPFPTPSGEGENTTCECGDQWFVGGAVVIDSTTGHTTGRTVGDWRCASCGRELR